MNVEGRATIACTVDAKGGLQACEVAAESPADQDFGEAALRMSRLHPVFTVWISGVGAARTS